VSKFSFLDDLNNRAGTNLLGDLISIIVYFCTVTFSFTQWFSIQESGVIVHFLRWGIWTTQWLGVFILILYFFFLSVSCFHCYLWVVICDLWWLWQWPNDSLVFFESLRIPMEKKLRDRLTQTSHFIFEI
jgi:hypothetical protein